MAGLAMNSLLFRESDIIIAFFQYENTSMVYTLRVVASFSLNTLFCKWNGVIHKNIGFASF
jgi:hypothetical protein